MTWEESVAWMRSQPDQQQSVLDNYFEPDLLGSCIRFEQGEEFRETLKYIKKYIAASGVSLLDIGAGRGIASYAFAKHGFDVTALEPDTSNDVGTGAIRLIAGQAKLNIKTVEEVGEKLPFENSSFGVVYARQVLHHAGDLPQFLRECARVLNKGGVFISTRDHVISGKEQLDNFLKSHSLHHLYGGENAFTENEYENAIRSAGLNIRQRLRSYDSVVNYFPLTENQLKENIYKKLSGIFGRIIAKWMISQNYIIKAICRAKSNADKMPGRLVSFISVKD